MKQFGTRSALLGQFTLCSGVVNGRLCIRGSMTREVSRRDKKERHELKAVRPAGPSRRRRESCWPMGLVVAQRTRHSTAWRSNHRDSCTAAVRLTEGYRRQV